MIYYIFSLILSSFLLFQIQPLIGKYILPWFGSSPAVWSASLLFFQSVLTFGYAYSYWLVGRFTLKRQAKIHLILTVSSVIVLIILAFIWEAPILPHTSFQPNQWMHPFWSVMRVLLVSVGIPLFLLSTNSTLLQSWFSKMFPQKSPYRLYALSNLASLVGLLSYPFVIEFYFKTVEQAWLWTGFYILFAVSICFIGYKLLNQETYLELTETSSSQDLSNPNPQFMRKPRFSDISLWFFLPVTASVLLLATTNQITQEIAVIPLLWVLPLALYLISFILTFESDRWYGRKRFTFILTISVFAYWLLIREGPLAAIELQITTYALLMFVCCMICHGELA